MAVKMPILFVNTATLPPLGADTWIHAQIMRALDRSQFELHAACATGRRGRPTPTYALLRTIPALDIIPVDFGPELAYRSTWMKVRGVLETVPAIWGLAK